MGEYFPTDLWKVVKLELKEFELRSKQNGPCCCTKNKQHKQMTNQLQKLEQTEIRKQTIFQWQLEAWKCTRFWIGLFCMGFGVNLLMLFALLECPRKLVNG